MLPLAFTGDARDDGCVKAVLLLERCELELLLELLPRPALLDADAEAAVEVKEESALGSVASGVMVVNKVSQGSCS